MTVSGKRHDFQVRYNVGFSENGKINGIKIILLSNGGNVLDLSGPVMTRALTHLDNCYSFKNFFAKGYICKTNTVSNTAFRGFGGPQGMLAIENILDEISKYLKKPLNDVRAINYYNKKNGLKTPYGQLVKNSKLQKILNEIEKFSNFSSRFREIQTFNEHQIKNGKSLRKGIAMMPAKFGISFNKPSLNQAGALVNVYMDGSIRLNHGGTEMGQGLFIKVAQVVAECFGVTLDKVFLAQPILQRFQIHLQPLHHLDRILMVWQRGMHLKLRKNRMEDLVIKLFNVKRNNILFRDNLVFYGNKSISFKELCFKCWENRVSLSSTGFYKTPKIFWDQVKLKGRPYFYYTWGAAISKL